MRNKYFYEKLDSTMSEFQRLKELNDQPLVVQAGTQNDGIGRNDHLWLSPPGGLWFTFDLSLQRSVPSFALYAGFCVHSCLERLFAPLRGRLKIKWTNDIILDGKKLGGILCRYQSAKHTYTIGIGINTNNVIDPELGKFGAISLKEALGFEISNHHLCLNLIDSTLNHCNKCLEDMYFLTYCNNHLFGKGHQARLETGGLTIQAEIISIDPSGALLIRKEMGDFVLIHTGSILEIMDYPAVFLDR